MNKRYEKVRVWQDQDAADAVNEWFKYHPPIDGGNQGERYSALRESARLFAVQIVRMCPHGDDRNAALQKLREVVYVANASIACGEVATNGFREI